MSDKAKASDTVPHVTAPLIDEFLSLEKQRLEKQREADALKRQAEPIKEKLLAYVRAKGGKGLTVLRSGFRLAIKLVNGSPSWKSEFIRVAGPIEAAKVAANPPQRESLEVERVG